LNLRGLFGLLDEMRGENMEGEAFLITFKKVGLEE
jgi:hypothetical protein